MEKVGLIGATAIGLGAIIGAGIFVLSGVAIHLAGSGAILAFLITGAVAAMIALEVGELASRMPGERGASYSFTYKVFGSELGFTTGMLRLLSYVASIAAIATGFGSYLASFLGIGNIAYQFAFSIALILGLAFITYRGIRSAARTDTVLVGFKVIVLIIFIVFGLYVGRVSNISVAGLFGSGWNGIFEAGVISMFAYAGFQSIASITPYLKGGGKTAARAIILSVSISALLYIGVTIAMLMMAPPGSYGVSADPLAFALSASNAPYILTLLVSIAALVATASATLAMLVGCNMLIYQMSLDNLLPQFLRKSSGNGSKANSLAAAGVLGIAMLFAGNIYIIAAISNFGTIFSYLINSLAIVKIRMLERSAKHRDVLSSMHMSGKNIFSMPLYPYIPIAAVIALGLFFFGLPVIALAGGIAVILLSIVIYYILQESEGKAIIRIKLFK